MQAFATALATSSGVRNLVTGYSCASARKAVCDSPNVPTTARASALRRSQFFAGSSRSGEELRFFAGNSDRTTPSADSFSLPSQRFEVRAEEESTAVEEPAAAPLKTYITCPSCGASYTIAKEAIPADGREVKCGKCEYQWFVKAEELKELATNQRFRRFVAAKDIFNIYVGNLSFKANEDDLMDEFSRYGEVHRVSIPLDKETGRSRGFAFVEMVDKDAGRKAVEELNGASIAGREVSVSEAKPKTSSTGNNYRRERR